MVHNSCQLLVLVSPGHVALTALFGAARAGGHAFGRGSCCSHPALLAAVHSPAGTAGSTQPPGAALASDSPLTAISSTAEML